MIRCSDMTPGRLACLKAIAALGGKGISHEHPDLAPFCDDASTMTSPDVFNQCHNAGWLISGHDDRLDASYVHLTEAGKLALTNGERDNV